MDLPSRTAVEVRGPFKGCWVWQGPKVGGYGRVSYDWAKNLKTHRLAYELLVGPIPEGLFVCHRCDTPACWNPAHLFLGTAEDNVRDMLNKRRWDFRGEKCSQAKLTQAQVDEIRRRWTPYTKGLAVELAAEFGITRSGVENIVCGRCWGEWEPPQRVKTCELPVCSAEFLVNSTKRRFCSDACKAKDKRQRAKGRAA